MSDISEKSSGFGIGEAGRVPASTPLDEIEAEILQPAAREKMIRCSCGHTIPASLVMGASLGSCCPDCYDRMSD